MVKWEKNQQVQLNGKTLIVKNVLNINNMAKLNVIDAISSYCDRIEHKGKHYKAYVKGTDKIIAFSKTPSDRNYARQIYRDFRRLGIIIKELNY